MRRRVESGRNATVVEIVEVGAAPRFVVAVVSWQWRDVRVELVKEKMDGVQGPHQRRQRARVVQKVLDRMHAETTPWAGVVALVVQRMRDAIQPGSHVAVHQSRANIKPWVHDSGFLTHGKDVSVKCYSWIG